MNLQKYNLILVNLNPALGSEQQGMRPCLVVQNNIANHSTLNTVAVAPFTSSLKVFPASVIVTASNENGLQNNSRLELSQIRTIDKKRVIKILGKLENIYFQEISSKLSLFLDLENQW